MKIIEKITDTQYLGQKETSVYEGTRYLITTTKLLNENDIITKENPIQGTFQTLCELCNDVYGVGEDYNERMKDQAIDFICGFITKEEIEIID